MVCEVAAFYRVVLPLEFEVERTRFGWFFAKFRDLGPHPLAEVEDEDLQEADEPRLVAMLAPRVFYILEWIKKKSISFCAWTGFCRFEYESKAKSFCCCGTAPWNVVLLRQQLLEELDRFRVDQLVPIGHAERLVLVRVPVVCLAVCLAACHYVTVCVNRITQ